MKLNTRARLALVSAGALLASGGLAACGSSDGNDTGAGGTKVEGGTIVYAHEQEPPCIFGGWIQHEPAWKMCTPSPSNSLLIQPLST